MSDTQVAVKVLAAPVIAEDVKSVWMIYITEYAQSNILLRLPVNLFSAEDPESQDHLPLPKSLN